MLKNDGNGWSTLRLVEVNGDEPNIFIVHPSYITDVPEDTLRAFIHYYKYGTGTVYYDLEGDEFFMVLNGKCIYILDTDCKTDKRDGPLPTVFHHIEIDDLAEEVCKDIEGDIDNWAEFNVYDPERCPEAVAAAKETLLQMVAEIREHLKPHTTHYELSDEEIKALLEEIEIEEVDDENGAEEKADLTATDDKNIPFPEHGTNQEIIDWLRRGETKNRFAICNKEVNPQSKEDAAKLITEIFKDADVDLSQYCFPCYNWRFDELSIRYYANGASVPATFNRVMEENLAKALLGCAAFHADTGLTPWHCTMITPEYAETIFKPFEPDFSPAFFAYKLGVQCISTKEYTDDKHVPEGFSVANSDVYSFLYDEYLNRFAQGHPTWSAFSKVDQPLEDISTNEQLPAKAITALLDEGFCVFSAKLRDSFNLCSL